MEAAEIPATEPDSGYEPIPLDALLDSEPDEEDAWELVPVDEGDIDFVTPSGETNSEAAARSPQDEGSAREGEHDVRPDAPGEPPQPKHSMRSEYPGPKGCWALNGKGEPCGAAKLRTGDYCAAHSGVGLSSDPAAYAPQGNEASRQARAAQARLRLELGITRPNSLRGHLRARAYAERERLAARVVSGALDDPRLALRVIEAVDPAVQASVSVGLPDSAEAVGNLSTTQLLALGESLGISANPSPDARASATD